MKKEQGVTMIELMVAIALMAILVSMINPIMNSINRAHKKEETINKIDSSIGKSIDIIKREVRGTRPIGISVSGGGTTGSSLILTKPGGTTINFSIDTSTRCLKVGGGKLAENITDGWFRYEEGVVVIYLEVTVDGTVKKIRDAAVTRLKFK